MLSIKRVGQVQTTKLAINDVLKILKGGKLIYCHIHSLCIGELIIVLLV